MLEYPEFSNTTSAPKRLVVFLHGVGSDGNDLISLAPFFTKELPESLFISPDGLEPYDMAPYGRQWFSLIDRTPEVIINLVDRNCLLVDEIIKNKQNELGLGNKNTIIIGFSQGTMMGLYLTLSANEPYLAMIGFSGRLIPVKKVNNRSTPICLIHGVEDRVVPSSESKKAAEFLSTYSIINTILIIQNLQHSIDAKGIDFACRFLKKHVLK